MRFFLATAPVAADCLLLLFGACCLSGAPRHHSSAAPTRLRLVALQRRLGPASTLKAPEAAAARRRRVAGPGGAALHRTRRRHDECERSYATRIADHCRYPGMSTPCFAADDSNASENGGANTSAPNSTVERAARGCCADGRRCSSQDFERLCCRTPECLSRCYGADFRRRKHVGGVTSAEEPPDRTAGHWRKDCGGGGGDSERDDSLVVQRRFRFLDIIARPNPRGHSPSKA